MPQSNTADSLQKEKSEEKLNFMQKETKQLIFQERKHRKERKGNGREGRGGEGRKEEEGRGGDTPTSASTLLHELNSL